MEKGRKRKVKQRVRDKEKEIKSDGERGRVNETESWVGKKEVRGGGGGERSW